jgi:hypothetical protein
MASAAAGLPGGDLSALPRRELQALAKACGLKANAKSDELAAQLMQLRDATGGAPAGAAAAPAPAPASAQAGAQGASAGAQAGAEPQAPPAEDDGGDIAALARQLEPVFCTTLESPVVGLMAGFTRRRGGAAHIAATPGFEFGAAPRTTLTPEVPLSGGSDGWMARARASLGALVSDWGALNNSPRPPRPSLLRASFSGAVLPVVLRALLLVCSRPCRRALLLPRACS